MTNFARNEKGTATDFVAPIFGIIKNDVIDPHAIFGSARRKKWFEIKFLVTERAYPCAASIFGAGTSFPYTRRPCLPRAAKRPDAT